MTFSMETKDDELILAVKRFHILKGGIVTSFAFHHNFKMHTDVAMTLCWP